jgi:hypothetical protein
VAAQATRLTATASLLGLGVDGQTSFVYTSGPGVDGQTSFV